MDKEKILQISASYVNSIIHSYFVRQSMMDDLSEETFTFFVNFSKITNSDDVDCEKLEKEYAKLMNPSTRKHFKCKSLDEIPSLYYWCAKKFMELDSYWWSKQYKGPNQALKEQLKPIIFDFLQEMKTNFNWNELSAKTCENLGFLKYAEDSDLYLIPYHLMHAIPEGTELTDIFGGTKIFGTDYINGDIRFGCIAYGIHVKKAE